MFVPVFDHSDFAIFDKPAGVSVHSEYGAGFVAQLSQQVPQTPWYLAHRLDRATSGLLIMAKSAAAAGRFGALFSSHAVEKYYLAIACGTPTKKQGLICGDMERSRNGQWKLCRTQQHPAITQFFSTAITTATSTRSGTSSDASTRQGPGARLYLLRPHTGRTHQLRVALKSLGVPIFGDERYGRHDDRTATTEAADRMYLHAYSLSFRWGDEQIRLAYPPSGGVYFEGVAQVLEEKGWTTPWQLTWPRLPGPVGDSIMRPDKHLPDDQA